MTVYIMIMHMICAKSNHYHMEPKPLCTQIDCKFLSSAKCIQNALICMKPVTRTSGMLVFLPRYAVKFPHIRQHLNKFVQVIEMYDTSNNQFKQEMSRQYHGMAAASFINELGEDEEPLF